MTTSVLIVDDAADVRDLLALIIETQAEDWVVVGHAGNGREAVERAVALQPSLVVLDLSMPVMDGLEALPLLRAQAPGAAVAVLSGFPRADVLAAVTEAGAHACLQKEDLVASLVPALTSLMNELHQLPEQRGSTNERAVDALGETEGGGSREGPEPQAGGSGPLP